MVYAAKEMKNMKGKRNLYWLGVVLTPVLLVGCSGGSGGSEMAQDYSQYKEQKSGEAMPASLATTYTYQAADGSRKTAVSKAPKGAESYRFNADIFPKGKASGEYVSSYDGENVDKGRFMSYQQFYSGVDGSRRTQLMFDQWVDRDEPFEFNLPVGLTSKATDLPESGELLYQGQAIDGERFGLFTYGIDFKNKVGQGGSIVWSGEGELGDVLLAGDVPLKEQTLAMMADPDIWGEHVSHVAPGVSGKATIVGQEGDFAYTAVLFGPKAEELAGIVYERTEFDDMHGHIHAADSDDHDHDHDHHGHMDQKNVASFAGKR